MSIVKDLTLPGMVEYAYNPNTREAGPHNNTLSAEKKTKGRHLLTGPPQPSTEDISLDLHSPSTLSQSFSFPNHRTGECVHPTAQISSEPGPAPRLEEAITH